MARWLFAAAWVGMSVAAAGPRTFVIAAGDCRDLDLDTNRRAFSEELRKRLGPALLDEKAAKELLAPEPASTVEDLQRLLDTVRQQYYQAQYEKAETQLEQTLREISRLPVGTERWSLTTSGELLRALIYRNTRREKPADEAFRRVLRLDPTYQMDPNYYSPNTRARFDRVRKEVETAKKVRLAVTSLPPASNVGVYLDGRLVGTTPFSAELLAGQYELALAKDQERSLPHALNLRNETSLQVDFGFESAVHPQRLPCLSRRPEAEILGYTVSLAPLLGVEEIAVVRLELPTSGPGWLAVTLVNGQTGGKIREGGLKFQRTAARIASGLPDLAEFVVTGKPSANVDLNPKISREGLDPAAPAPAVPSSSVAAQEVVREDSAPSGRTWKTPVGIGLLAAGVVGGGGAGWMFQRSATIQWNEHDSYFDPQHVPTANDAESISALRLSATAAQKNALIALTAGGVVAATGGVLLIVDQLLGRPRGPSTSGISVTVGPTSVGASVRFH